MERRQVAALVAFNYGTINNSHSINGNIRGDRGVGGLVGFNFGTIYNSSVINGNIRGDRGAGGFGWPVV